MKRDEGDRRRVEGAAPGRTARLEGAADPRPRARGDLLGAGRCHRRPRLRPLLRHRRTRHRGALARAPPAPSSSTATPGRRWATSSGSASASAPSWSAPMPVAGSRATPGPVPARFDLVFVDAPYKLADRVGQELNTHLPRLLADDGRAVVESGARRALAARLARACCVSAVTAPPTSPSTGSRVDG